MTDWTNRLAGARMQVDQQFQDRVSQSQFTNQQWGLIMTAVEWEIHEADDPEAAKLVADTSKLPDIVPELDRIQQQVGPGADPSGSSSEGGIAGRLKDIVGSLSGESSGSDGQDKQREAEALVQDYASQLQSFLENHDRWDEVRTAAASETAETDESS